MADAVSATSLKMMKNVLRAPTALIAVWALLNWKGREQWNGHEES
jgi:hypothetical protein